MAPQPRLYEHVSPSLRTASGPTLQPVLGGQVGSRTALHPNPAPYLSSQSLSFPDCKLARLAQGVSTLGSHRPAQLCHMGKDNRLLGSFSLPPLLADTSVHSLLLFQVLTGCAAMPCPRRCSGAGVWGLGQSGECPELSDAGLTLRLCRGRELCQEAEGCFSFP